MQFVFIPSTDVVISMFERNILEFYLNIFIFHLDFNTILARKEMDYILNGC